MLMIEALRYQYKTFGHHYTSGSRIFPTKRPIHCKEIMLKVILLVTMCFNQVAHNLLIAYSRQLSSSPLYFSSTVVFLSEAFKLLFSLGMLIQACNWKFNRLVNLLYREVLKKPVEFLKLFIPAALYALQNNLVYTALSNLDPATYQVSTNLKIFTTALFMWLIMGHRLTVLQIVALVMLFVGVIIVQLTSDKINSISHNGNYFIGLLAVLVISLCAGFAGVYFEKLLKHTNVPFWVRNFEIYIWGMFSSGIAIFSEDIQSIVDKGFFFGYTAIVWIIVLLASAGGLYASLVMHYLDNILKNFVSSAAILVTAAGSAALFHTGMGMSFMFGTFLVCLSIFLYGMPLDSTNPPSSESSTR